MGVFTSNLLIFMHLLPILNKMNICQLILYLLLINGMISIKRVESVNKKLQKSFVEIFGEGWDEEERTEEIGKVARNWQNDDETQIQNDGNRPMIGDQPQQDKPSPSSSEETDQNDHKKEMETDQLSETQKREIIYEWYAIKEKIKRRKIGKWSTKQWIKVEGDIAKKLNTKRDYIYKWIREFGMGKKRTTEGTLAIMRRYWEMKQNDPKMSDEKIAKALQISRNSITRWKKKQKNIVTEEQTRKIVHEFQTIKNQIKQKRRKYSHKQWNKIEDLLANKLGATRTKIYKWIKELGMRQKMTDEQKLVIMRRYWEMKRNDPKMSDKEIVKALKISRQSIQRWKRKFGADGTDTF